MRRATAAPSCRSAKWRCARCSARGGRARAAAAPDADRRVDAPLQHGRARPERLRHRERGGREGGGDEAASIARLAGGELVKGGAVLVVPLQHRAEQPLLLRREHPQLRPRLLHLRLLVRLADRLVPGERLLLLLLEKLEALARDELLLTHGFGEGCLLLLRRPRRQDRHARLRRLLLLAHKIGVSCLKERKPLRLDSLPILAALVGDGEFSLFQLPRLVTLVLRAAPLVRVHPRNRLHVLHRLVLHLGDLLFCLGLLQLQKVDVGAREF